MSDQVYCSAPWYGLTIRENGDVRVCCDSALSLGNLNKVSMAEIEDSGLLKEIQDSMLSNQPHRNCEKCRQNEERTNYASLRNHYQRYYPLIDLEKKIKFLDIRWNNKCNLACQYCSPMFSSTWEERQGITLSPARKSYQDDLLDWILPKAKDVVEIMLVGGEPMLMKQNYQLIGALDPDCQISIITNLSYDIENIPCLENLLDRPKEKILWNVSVENTGERFEYVRTGADWEKFLANLRFLISNWPNTVSLNMVYSILNALDLDEILRFYRGLGIKKFTLQQLNKNSELDIFNLPREIQKIARVVAERAIQEHQLAVGSDIGYYPLTGLSSLAQGLDLSDNNVIITREQFYQKVEDCDRWVRGPKFRNLWPDVLLLIDKYLK